MSDDLSVLKQIGLTPEAAMGDLTDEPLPVAIDWSCIDNSINPWDFAIPSWLQTFRQRTIQTALVPLTKEFVEYLLEDGIDIPDEVYNLLPDSSLDEITFHPEIIAAIHKGIASFGGKVFPKLNWSSPKDGAWLSHDRSLQCTFVRDVLTLIKGSAKCVSANILDYPRRATTSTRKSLTPQLSGMKTLSPVAKYADENGQEVEYPHVLVLRKWSNLFPSREFRVFVAHKRIVAVSQRDMTLYEELQQASARQKIRRAIADSHADHIVEKFNHDHYVYDVYVDTKGRVWVVDFHPYSKTYCDGLLFDWDTHLFPFLAETEKFALPYDELKQLASPSNEIKQDVGDAKDIQESPKSKDPTLIGPGLAPSAESAIQGILRESTEQYLRSCATSRQRHLVVSHPSVESERTELKKAWDLQQREFAAKTKLRIEQIDESVAENENENENEGEAADEDWDDWLYPETSFSMRVVTLETEREGHRLSTLNSVLSRLPADGIDVSDANAIEKFIQDAKKRLAEESDSESDSETESKPQVLSSD